VLDGQRGDRTLRPQVAVASHRRHQRGAERGASLLSTATIVVRRGCSSAADGRSRGRHLVLSATATNVACAPHAARDVQWNFLIHPTTTPQAFTAFTLETDFNALIFTDAPYSGRS
jgi:hypothetical protein